MPACSMENGATETRERLLPKQGYESRISRLLFAPEIGRPDTTQEPCRVTGHDNVIRHAAGHHAPGTHDRIFPNRYIGQNCCPGADRCTSLHHGRLDYPILLRLQVAFWGSGPGV